MERLRKLRVLPLASVSSDSPLTAHSTIYTRPVVIGVPQVSSAAKSLCMWARAMYTYDKVAKNIGPKKEALAQAEGELEVVQNELGKKQEALRKVKCLNDSSIIPLMICSWWRGAVFWARHVLSRPVRSCLIHQPGGTLGNHMEEKVLQ